MSITLRSLNRDIHWRGSKGIRVIITLRKGCILQGFTLLGDIPPPSFFGAKKEAKKHPPPPRPPPIWGGCNRSSCRSYINVSSDHHRSGLVFIDYAGRWSICERWLGPSARALLAYMSEASLKKGPAWVLSTTLDAGRLYELGFIDYARRWSIRRWSIKCWSMM